MTLAPNIILTPGWAAVRGRWVSCLWRALLGGWRGCACLLWVALWPTLAAAFAPAAGSFIRNQTVVTYYTGSYAPAQVLYSNEISLRVAEKEAFVLLEDGRKRRVVPGERMVDLPHVLINTGNAPSTYKFVVRLDSCNFVPPVSLFHDRNNNGLADEGEPELKLEGGGGSGGNLPSLAAGASVSLVLRVEVPAAATPGTTCRLQFDAATTTTTADIAKGSVADILEVKIGPSFRGSKASNVAGDIVPGQEVLFTVNFDNTGTAAAAASARMVFTAEEARAAEGRYASGSYPLKIDNKEESRLLLRDVLAPGLSYERGSLRSDAPAAERWYLYRLAGAAPFSYQREEPGDPSTVVEVAVALPGLEPRAAVGLSFRARVSATMEGAIKNTAELFSAAQTDASGAAEAVRSNTLRLYTSLQPGPDLVVKAFAVGNFSASLVNTFIIQADNVGQGATDSAQPIVVTIEWPQGAILDEVEGVRGANWTCAPDKAEAPKVSQSARCTFASLPGATEYSPSRAPPISLRLRIDPKGPLAKSSGMEGTVHISGGGEARSRQENNTARLVASIVGNSSIKGTVWHDLNHNRVLDDKEPRLGGWEVELASYSKPVKGSACPEPRVAAGAKPELNKYPHVAPCFKPLRRSTTDSNGGYVFSAVSAGEGYAILFRTPAGYQVGIPVNGDQREEMSPGEAVGRDFLTIAQADTTLGALYPITVMARVNYVQQSLPVDYGGVVYDSVTRQPVAGVTVRLQGPTGFEPALHLVGGERNVEQRTLADGTYALVLSAAAPAGRYRLQVTAPSNYRFPSSRVPPRAQALAVPAWEKKRSLQVVQTQASAPASTEKLDYYLDFDVVAGAQRVVNNHIPIDPFVDGLPWVVQKTADKTTVEVVDFVQYTVTLINETGMARTEATVYDQPATGFTYVPGSAYITLPDGKRVRTEPLLERDASPGRRMKFVVALPLAGSSSASIEPKEKLSLSYRMAVQVTAAQGYGVNLAWADSQKPVPTAPSNRAKATVRVKPGVFTPDGLVMGRVFLDCNRDGAQQADEVGVPGIRMYMEDGRFVVSDKDGRFSLYGLMPTTHTLKIDDLSVPGGASAVWGATSGRNADLGWVRGTVVARGRATTHFIDLKNGEMQTAAFALQSCDAATVQDVQQRRDASAERPKDGDELAARAAGAQAQFAVIAPSFSSSDSDLLSRPAAGVIDPKTGAIKAALVLPGLGGGALPQSQQAAPMSLNLTNITQALETYLEGKPDPELVVLNLKEGQVLPYAQTSIQVKGRMGNVLGLRVNGEVVSSQRIGKRSEAAAQQAAAVEYVAIPLREGRNEIVVTEADSLGNERKRQTLHVLAPGKLAKVELKVLSPELVADGQTPVPIQVRLTDAQGTPVAVSTQITLKASVGHWPRSAASATVSGDMEVMVHGGQAVVYLVPPPAPVQGELVVRASLAEAKMALRFTPHLRPLMAVGVLDGVVDFSRINLENIVPVRKSDGFDEALTDLAKPNGEGQDRPGVRAAFFLKGKVLGKYLLTAAYDSNKQREGRLFRDIKPDEYYPIYGDDSVKGFEAQSSGRLYVRVDRDRNYVLYGDYSAAGDASRRLTQVSRGLHGVKAHIEEDVPGTKEQAKFTSNLFAAKGSQKQILEELPTNGTTGPFRLREKDILENSEEIDVLAYDRRQPQVLITTKNSPRRLNRYTDYSIDYDNGVVRLREPLPSADQDGNPLALKVRYEKLQGGDPFWVTGVDAQIDYKDQVKVGAVTMKNNDPARPEQLRGVYAQVVPLPGLSLVAEHVTARMGAGNGIDAQAPKAGGKTQQGSARRVEARYDAGPVTLRTQWQKADADYAPSQPAMSKGREEALVEASARLATGTTVKADARLSKDGAKDALMQSTERQQQVMLTQQLGGNASVEAGLRRTQTTQTTNDRAKATSVSVTEQGTTARVKVSATLPVLKQTSGFVEYEREVQRSEGQTLAVGGEHSNSIGRVYARHEVLSTETPGLGKIDRSRNNRTQVGAEVKLGDNTSAYSEYRVAGSSAAESNPASLVYGLRQRLQLSKAWTLTGNYERSRSLGNKTGDGAKGENSSVSVSAGYAGADDARLSARVEKRWGAAEEALNLSLAASHRLSPDYAMLLRSRYESQQPRNAGTSDNRAQQRHQLGLVYRPYGRNDVNVLGSIERVSENTISAAGAAASTSRLAWIVSTHATWQPMPKIELSGRFAAKWLNVRFDNLDSYARGRLLFTRVRYDLASRWDVGLHHFMLAGTQGASQYGYGIEGGYKFSEDVWVSLGYNHLGFVESDLAGPEQTRKGVYLRMRVKF